LIASSGHVNGRSLDIADVGGEITEEIGATCSRVAHCLNNAQSRRGRADRIAACGRRQSSQPAANRAPTIGMAGHCSSARPKCLS
jgi:hypothetical protein